MSTKKTILAFAIGIFMAGTVAAQAQSSGKLEVIGGNTFDWGNVKPATLTTTLKVKNVGSGPLTIKDVKKSCGCTTPTVAKNILEPGETTDIGISVTASTSTGHIQKNITIITDGPETPSVAVTLKANILRDVTVFPSWVQVLNGKIGDASTSTVKVTNSGTAPLTLQAPTTANANADISFDLSSELTLKPGESRDIAVTVKPTEAGNLHGAITIKTSSMEQPEIRLELAGNAVAADAAPATKQTR